MSIKVSFIICTYNYLEINKCLNSILNQKYDKNKIEIIIVDGGSNDGTFEIIKNYKNTIKKFKILKNKNKLPEGYGNGKWLGWKHAEGEFVAIVDQDNEIQDKDFIKKVIECFEEKEVFGVACRLQTKKTDNLTNQYISLQGTDPFMAYRSLDGIINLNKELFINKKDKLFLEIDKNNIIITGGNCFIYRKKYLDNVGGYIQDTENIFNLVKKRYNKIAILKNIYTHHKAVKGFFDFIRKKKKWAREYNLQIKNKNSFSYFPENKIERKKLILNVFFITTIFPNLFISIKKMFETREKAWLLHAPLTFITEFIYGFYVFMK